MMPNVRNNIAESRFELDIDGHTAFAYYSFSPGVITFMHTEVPEALSGRGIGSQLAKGALDLVRAQKLSRGAMPVRRGLYRQACGVSELAQIAIPPRAARGRAAC